MQYHSTDIGNFVRNNALASNRRPSGACQALLAYVSLLQRARGFDAAAAGLTLYSSIVSSNSCRTSELHSRGLGLGLESVGTMGCSGSSVAFCSALASSLLMPAGAQRLNYEMSEGRSAEMLERSIKVLSASTTMLTVGMA